MKSLLKDKQYYKFSLYGFLRNLRFFDAFFILFLIEKGLSFTEIGILYAVREIFINLFEIPSGIFADTFGRKKALISSFILYIISFIVFYFAIDFWLFMIAFIFFGMGDAFRSGTHKGMIMHYLKINNREDQKINYYGHTRSWSQKGLAISALAAGLIVFYSGSYANIFLYSIIPYLLNLLLILSYPVALNQIPILKNRKNIYRMLPTWQSFIISIKQPHVFKIINTTAIHSAFLKAVKDYIQPLMVSVAFLIPFMLAYDVEKKNGLIIGGIYFIIFLITSQASKFSVKVIKTKRKNIAYLTLLISFIFGILCGIFFIFELWIISLIAFVGIYIIENIRKPILTGFVADKVNNEILTSVLSAQSQLKTIMTVILALGFGFFADMYGIGIALIVVSGFLILLTVGLNLIFNKK